MRGAFLTYNMVGDGSLSSGWHERGDNQALVLQNTKGFKVAVDENIGDVQSEEDLPEGYFRSDNAHVSVVKNQIEQLWDQLTQELDSLDFMVIYVGSTGSERFIELAKSLPAEKITFVGCDCRLDKKTWAIRDAGLWEAGRLLCECGGRRTLRGMLEHFLDTGIAPNEQIQDSIAVEKKEMEALRSFMSLLENLSAEA